MTPCTLNLLDALPTEPIYRGSSIECGALISCKSQSLYRMVEPLNSGERFGGCARESRIYPRGI